MATRKALVLVGGQLRQLPAGDVLDTGDPGFVPVATPAIGAPFQVSTTESLTLNVSVRTVATSSLVGGAQSGRVEILCDGANPPTTVRDQIENGQTGVLVVGLTIVQKVGGNFRIKVPAGSWVLLRVVADAGSAAPVCSAQLAYAQRG